MGNGARTGWTFVERDTEGERRRRRGRRGRGRGRGKSKSNSDSLLKCLILVSSLSLCFSPFPFSLRPILLFFYLLYHLELSPSIWNMFQFTSVSTLFQFSSGLETMIQYLWTNLSKNVIFSYLLNSRSSYCSTLLLWLAQPCFGVNI